MEINDVINLIKYHIEEQDEKFIEISFKIAKDLDKEGFENESSKLFEILCGDYSWCGQKTSKN